MASPAAKNNPKVGKYAVFTAVDLSMDLTILWKQFQSGIFNVHLSHRGQHTKHGICGKRLSGIYGKSYPAGSVIVKFCIFTIIKNGKDMKCIDFRMETRMQCSWHENFQP
jgi:hypothetical protein